ncbi:MAG: nuclear transport factor 2 family protein [Caldilineaceae bacterium]
MSNLQTVQTIYEAFGRGDGEAILAHCVAAPEWEYGSESTAVPWLRHQTDRAGALANMQAGMELAIEKFVLKDLLEGNGVVVALLDIEFTVKRTGKRVSEVDAVQIWRFNEAGLVTQFRQRVDTRQQHLAWEA